MDDKLRAAVYSVLEGWTLPDGVRKILEAAYYSAQPPRAEAGDGWHDDFTAWWESPETERRFHCGHFSDKEMAAAAIGWFIGRATPPMVEAGRGVDDARDARLWRGLIGSARIRPWGSAGLDQPREDHYAHLGLEIWTLHMDAESCAKETARGREWLTKYAEHAAALSGKAGKGVV